MADEGKIARGDGEARAMRAAAGLYHAYFTGLILTLVTRRNARDAAEWVFRVFRAFRRVTRVRISPVK